MIFLLTAAYCLGVSAEERARHRRMIRGQVASIAAAYHFTPQ